MPRIQRPPSAPAIVAGMVNVGGTPLIVVDLTMVLTGEPSRPGFYWNIVRLRHGTPPVGFLVAHADQVVSLNPDDVRAAPAGETLNDCIAGEFDHEGESVHLLDIDRILLERERQVLAALQSECNRRLEDLSVVPDS